MVYDAAMRTLASTYALVGLALFPLACGGASSTTPQTPSSVAVGSEPATASPPPNLTTVEEPQNIVVIARWKNPKRVFDTLQQWVGIPLPAESGVEDLLRAPGVGAVIDMTTPVDVVVALDESSSQTPKAFVSFSMGLRSVQEAREAFSRKREVKDAADGAFRVELGPEWDTLPCIVSPALGSAPARLVCGPRNKDVEILQPFMARGLPVMNLPDRDLVGEVRLAPLQNKYGKMLPQLIQMGSSVASHELGTGDRNLDRAISDTVGELGKELLALSTDLDSLRFETQLEPDAKTLTGEMSLAFQSRTSWLAQRFFDNAEKAGPPPALFWNAPIDSTSVAFDRGSSPSHFASFRRHGGNLLDAALARENLPLADRKEVVALFEKMFEGFPTTITAQGPVLSSKTATTKAGELQEAATAALGWYVLGLDENSTRIDAWLQDVSRVYARPTIQRWLRTTSGLDANHLPQVRYGAMATAGLPGLKALQVSIPATLMDASSKNEKPLIYYIMMLPDGNRTWLATGADQASLINQLKAAKTGGASTINSRKDLEALRSARAVGGGFFTMTGIVHQASNDIMDVFQGYNSRNSELQQFLAAIPKLPHRGNAPMFITTRVDDGSPARVTVQFKVTRETVEDLRALILTMGGLTGPVPTTPRTNP